MKKLVSVMMLTLALGAFAFTQGGGGGGRGGQRGGGGAQFARAGAQFGLLSHEDVQTALKLTDDQKAAITKAGADRRAAMTGMDPQADAATRTAAMTKAGADYASAINGTLHDDQKTKLLGIFAVVAKNPALENPDVQAAIGLGDDEKTKIKDLVAAEAKAGAALRQQQTDGTMDAAAVRAARTKNQETLSTDLMGALSSDHKAAFAKLQSDAGFTPAQGVNYFGGGAGGRRGGAGGAAGGGRRAGGGGAAGGGN